jgi:tetratricopeptide (TPR) repeat protein
MAAAMTVATFVVCYFGVTGSAVAQAVRGEASVNTAGGFARLEIRLAKEVESQVRISGNVLVIQFKQPVDVPVNRITVGATAFIGAARRDPDSRALRFALARKVTINSMNAGERLFVDLLPEDWTGEPPGLPREVVEELAQRARDAERIARQKIEAERLSKIPPVRVRVATQPTFTRYIFELPELTSVTTERSKDKLKLSFGGPLRFDLADAKLALPMVVEAIESGDPSVTTVVQFSFAQEADVRTFREDSNFVVDVSPISVVRPKVVESRQGAAIATQPQAAAQTLAGQVSMPGRQAARPSVPGGVDPTSPAKKPVANGAASATSEPVPPAAPENSPDGAAKAMPHPTASKQGSHGGSSHSVVVELSRQGDNLRLHLPFATPTPAAVFQRADTLWLVFDSAANLEVGGLANDPSRTIRSVAVNRVDDAQVVRLKLERPRLVSVTPEGHGWQIAIGESNQSPTRPLAVIRNIAAKGRTSVTIPFENPHKLHKLDDPDVGDQLLVVTGPGPARGLIKTQDFVEFRALATAQGIAIQALADDLKAELSVDKVLLTRPAGLTLSDAGPSEGLQPSKAVTFNTQLWKADREAKFFDRQVSLIRDAAAASPTQRTARRLELARFYLSRQMYAEAKAVLDTAIADERPTAEDPSPLVLRAVSEIMTGRIDDAQKDLASPLVGNQNDAPLWRALAFARQGKWAEAHDAFRYVEGVLGALPIELQRIALKDALRASIEAGDFPNAANRLNEFKTVGVPTELEPDVAVLTGRLAESTGRTQSALANYRFAVASGEGPAAAQGRLRAAKLRYKAGELSKSDAITELEGLTAAWRGDETEIEALQFLAHLYIEERRYRDLFRVMRVALKVHPDSALTRKIHDEAAGAFDSLFLVGKADALPAIDALSLFYDFRDLTPIGRRGDEMIRRLAERLVSVELLDQAAELLQYQVDNRLQGAARAQVATRLAVIYLMNHKPEQAQAVLRATRTADLSNEIRVPRLLIEARALSDMGRHDFALDVIEGIEGRESLRLRSDIYWAARRWQKAAEHIELLYGERWKSFEPLNNSERSDILRASLGYALAEDKIGMARLREKYVAKFASGPDRRAFDVVTSGLRPNSPEFRDVARVVASADSMASFLRELQSRYPEVHAISGTASKPADAKPVAPVERSDPGPTGTIVRPPLGRISAR